MDDLKKACDESSKETKPESVHGNFIRRLLFANTASNTVIEKKIGATLLQKLREQGLAQGGAALNERKNRLHQLNPFVQCVVTEHMLRYVVNDEAEGTEGCKFQKRIRCIPEESVTNKARGP